MGQGASAEVISAFDSSVAELGFSTIRLTPKARLASFGDLHLAAAAPVVLPLGTDSPYLDPGGPSLHPRAIVAWSPGVRLVANVGVALRGERDLADLALGPALAFGLGGEVPFEVGGGQRVEVLATVVGETGLRHTGEAETPLELLVGGRWRSPLGMSLMFAGGPGLTAGYGTPEYRVVGGIGFRPEGPPARSRGPAPLPVPVGDASPKPTAAPRAGSAHHDQAGEVALVRERAVPKAQKEGATSPP